MDYPPIHVLPYGDAGGFKSTFAASCPKPEVVFMFDPFGKEMPYLRRGIPAEVAIDERTGTPYRDVMSRKDGRLLIRVRYYLDADLTAPEAYSRFLKDLHYFQNEYDQWATTVFDSVTMGELVARKLYQYKLNRTAKDSRQWFGDSTSAIEEIVMGRFAAMPMNVVVIAHIDEDKDEVHGHFVRSPKMPGQRLRKGVAAAYSELYRCYVAKDEEGNAVPMMQTQSDNIWHCATQINAPNPCPPDYAALWANWRA